MNFSRIILAWIALICCDALKPPGKLVNRILVINCEDIPWEPISFFDMYRNNLARDGDIWTSCNIALGDSLPADVVDYTGIILTGSHYNCRKRDVYFPWYEFLQELIREVANAGKPQLFGGCFGHNLIALSLGGSVDFNPEKKYIIQVEDLAVNYNFLETFSDVSPSSILDSYSVISTHEDCVVQLPDSAKLLGSTQYCENSLFITGKHDNILACQSHPEFDLQYAVLDRIWLSVVKKRKMLSLGQVEESLLSFNKYDGAGAITLCGLISDFLHKQSGFDGP